MINIGKLMGKKVIGANAYTVGEVNGAQIDSEKWTVTHLHVSLSDAAVKVLGFRKPFMGSVTVCLPVSLVQAVGDVVALNKGIKDLREVVEPQKHN